MTILRTKDDAGYNQSLAMKKVWEKRKKNGWKNKAQKMRDDFLEQWVLLSNYTGWNVVRYFSYPENKNWSIKSGATHDYKLTDGEYIICRHLQEVIKELRRI